PVAAAAANVDDEIAIESGAIGRVRRPQLASGLDYTIIWPAWLTDNDEVEYEITNDPKEACFHHGPPPRPTPQVTSSTSLYHLILSPTSARRRQASGLRSAPMRARSASNWVMMRAFCALLNFE